MANANLNISIIEKRMLKQAEAANYTGLPVKHFKATCPGHRVVALRFSNDHPFETHMQRARTLLRGDALDRIARLTDWYEGKDDLEAEQ